MVIKLTRNSNNSNINHILSLNSDGTTRGELRIGDYLTSGSFVTINAVGNIGVGTTSPSQRLDVTGSISNRGSSTEGNLVFRTADFTKTGYIDFNCVTTGNTNRRLAYIGFGDSTIGKGLDIYADAGMYMNFYTNGNERMRLNSSGNLGIGTSSPIHPLHIVNNTNLLTIGTVGVFTGILNNGGASTYTGGGLHVINMYAERSIWVGNNVVASSDNRIKKNMIDINDDIALQVLRQLEPKTYNYIDQMQRTNTTVYGFSAQQVRSVLPYAVGLEREFVPNVYNMVTVGNSGTQLIFPESINTSVLENQVTDGSTLIRLKCYLDDNTELLANVTNIVNNNIVEIDKTITSGNIVFVYGQEVNDFHVLDKNTIWTVATSALQEVDRQLQETKQELNNVKQFLQNKFPSEI